MYISKLYEFEQKETALNNLNKIQCLISYLDNFYNWIIGEYIFI